MFTSVVAMVASLAAYSAEQSSFAYISGKPLADAPSVLSVVCTDCDRFSSADSQSTYHIPSLDNGHERVTLSERNGKPAVTRTGNWMGGSPVRYVSLNPVWVEQEQQMMLTRSATPTKDDGVDLKATTSAVSNDHANTVSATATSAPMEPVMPDFSKFELRPTR